jgi:hypothetical protein
VARRSLGLNHRAGAALFAVLKRQTVLNGVYVCLLVRSKKRLDVRARTLGLSILDEPEICGMMNLGFLKQSAVFLQRNSSQVIYVHYNVRNSRD